MLCAELHRAQVQLRRVQVHGGVAAVEEPGHVPPARPQQLLHAVAEEPGARQHFLQIT